MDSDSGKARLEDVPDELTTPFWFVFAWHAVDDVPTTTATGRSAAAVDSMPVTEALIA